MDMPVELIHTDQDFFDFLPNPIQHAMLANKKVRKIIVHTDTMSKDKTAYVAVAIYDNGKTAESIAPSRVEAVQRVIQSVIR